MKLHGLSFTILNTCGGHKDLFLFCRAESWGTYRDMSYCFLRKVAADLETDPWFCSNPAQGCSVTGLLIFTCILKQSHLRTCLQENNTFYFACCNNAHIHDPVKQELCCQLVYHNCEPDNIYPFLPDFLPHHCASQNSPAQKQTQGV